MSPNQNQNTVAVVGTGSVMVQPDLVQMYISLSNTSPTTAQAQAEVSKSLSQALAILKEANIEDKNIRTASLRFYAEYDYSNSKRVLIGQRAEQTIQFSIGGIEKDTKKVSSIIDRLATINGIQLNQMEFDVKDKTQHYAKARELAYQKALDKATQYANLAGQKIVKAINIAENGLTPISPIQYRSSNIMMKESLDISSATGTTLPTGELEITTDISVIFQIE